MPFRRAVTDNVVGMKDEKEVYPLHMVMLVDSDNDGDQLADDAELQLRPDDADGESDVKHAAEPVVSLHCVTKKFVYHPGANDVSIAEFRNSGFEWNLEFFKHKREEENAEVKCYWHTL